MPTPEDAPTALLRQKILASALEIAPVSGWAEETYLEACAKNEVSPDDVAYAFPSGAASLILLYFDTLKAEIKDELAALPLDEMRIRDKVTQGVAIWFEALSRHHAASVKALDWSLARPTGPLSMPELLWGVADTIWRGIGDTSDGFTYYSKRTTLSAVLGSTLAAWRGAEGNEPAWREFLDRRIENVMSFEKFKAQVKLPEVKLPF